MRLRSCLPLKDSNRWAALSLLGIWLAVTLLALAAGRVSAGDVSAPPLFAPPQAPAGTIVDADIVTDTVWTLAGSPYQVAFDSYGIQVVEAATLTVDPGVEVQFAPYASLIVLGTLKAIGTDAQPILFTGAVKEPGSWLFLAIESTSFVPNRGSVLRHVTIEYAQWNLMIQSARVHLSDCILRHASEVGLWASLAGGTVVEGCQIVDNGVSGLENSFGGLILAMNNWWGSASGPYHALCNPAGTGDPIEDTYSSGGVAFRPFLTAPGQEPAPVAAGQALGLSLAPQRWFAPADGVTLIPVKATLRDGAGYPVPGRIIMLQSDLGAATGASVTDSKGEMLAYVSSDTPGDATLTALVQSSDACEVVASSEAVVTFGEYTADPLLPGEAPYMNDLIQVEPMPIVQGVPGTVSALLSNPNAYPIEVNAAFSYATYGIGVAFGPLGGVEDVRIEANSDRRISVPWTPLVSGHACLRLDYVAQPAGRTGAGVQATGGGQTNFSIQPGPLGSPGTGEGEDGDEEEDPGDGDQKSEKDMLKKAKAAMDRINDGQMALDAVSSPENLTGLAIPNFLFSYIMDFNLDSWVKSTEAMGGDPPRQDYDTYATVDTYTFTPLVAGGDLSQARAAAGNALMEAMLDLTAQLRAAALSLDRYGGAANAGDLYWASEQAALLIDLKQESGATMLEVADRLDALLDVMYDEGIEDLTVPVAEVVAYQARLASEGFNDDEVQAAYAIGLSDDDLEAIRQARLAADPAEVAGSVVTRLAEIAADLRLLGEVLMNPPNFDETSTAYDAAAPAASTNLARIFVSRIPFQIGNPLPEAATVELRVRSLDLPLDWMVSVSPLSADLEPGEEVTGLITIRPGLAAAQGTRPRVAVEGYVDDELVGGAVVEVMVPRHVAAGPKENIYLPLILRRTAPW